MLQQTEIREVALLMIRRCGTNAAVQAMKRVHGLKTEAEREVAEIWQRVVGEIIRLRAEEREVYAKSLEIFESSAIDRHAG